MSKVKDIFFRALQRHPESEIINNTFFKILLHIAANMNSEKILANNTSEQDIGLEQAEIVYRNSKKKISNITYFISLLKICEEEFVNITAGLQKMILDDLMDMFPRNEQLWDILAQRELKGLNMSDLQSYTKTGEKSSNSMDIEEQEDVKDISLTNKTWYQKRTLKRRIELCCGIYQNAVRTVSMDYIVNFI